MDPRRTFFGDVDPDANSKNVDDKCGSGFTTIVKKTSNNIVKNSLFLFCKFSGTKNITIFFVHNFKYNYLEVLFKFHIPGNLI